MSGESSNPTIRHTFIWDLQLKEGEVFSRDFTINKNVIRGWILTLNDIDKYRMYPDRLITKGYTYDGKPYSKNGRMPMRAHIWIHQE